MKFPLSSVVVAGSEGGEVDHGQRPERPHRRAAVENLIDPIFFNLENLEIAASCSVFSGGFTHCLEFRLDETVDAVGLRDNHFWPKELDAAG